MTISTVTNEQLRERIEIYAREQADGKTPEKREIAAFYAAVFTELLAVREAQSVPALPANVIGRPATPDDSPYPATISGGCLLAQAWADGYNVRNAVTAAPAVPAGFKLVPVESNDAWAERYCELTNKHPDGGLTTYIGDGAVTITFREKSKREIDAMLAAAPTPTKAVNNGND